MEQKRTGLPYVFTLAKEERGKLGLGMLLAVFSSALSLVPYMVVYQILLLIIKNEVTLHTILKWAGIGIGAAVLQAIFTALAGICSHTAAFNTMHRIKVRVLEHMSKFNLGYFQEHAPGQIKTTLFDDVDRIENFLAHSTLELAQAIVVPLMMFLFMLRLNWNESSASIHICKFPSRYNLAYSSGSSIASEFNAQSEPGVVFKIFSASQQSMRSI